MVAQHHLGRMYRDGAGVQQDDTQAFYWYCKAAKQDHPEAQYELGLKYEEGCGVDQDFSGTLSWYRKALAGGKGLSTF